MYFISLLGVGVSHGPGKKWVHFGADPSHEAAVRNGLNVAREKASGLDA